MSNNITKLLLLFALMTGVLFADANKTQTNAIDENLTQTQKELIIENQKLQSVIDNLRDNKYIKNITNNKTINDKIYKLQNKININKRQRNALAVKRDELKVIALKEKLLYENTLVNIVKAKQEYRSKEYIENLISSCIKSIEENSIEKYTPTYESVKNVDSAITNEFKENYTNLHNQKYDYLFILQNLTNDISQFRKPNFFADDMSLDNIIEKIDNIAVISTISALTNAYFSFTIGETVIIFIIMFVFWMFERVLVPIVSSIIVNLLIRSKQEDSEKLKSNVQESIKTPLKYLIRFMAIGISLAIILQNEKLINKVNPWLDTIFMGLIAWIIYRILDNSIDIYASSILNKYPNIRKEMIVFVLKVIRIILIILVAMFLLTQLGMDIKAIAASLGVGGIAVALAAKDTLENFFASITIMADNSFSQGDWIKTSEVEGTVVDIRMRSTRIRTFDNSMITIPNSKLANTPVQNWSKRVIGRRIKMSIGITYESNMQNIKKLKDDIYQMLFDHHDIATNKNSRINYTSKKRFEAAKKEDLHGIKNTLLVFIDSYEDSSVNILIYCFTKSPEWEKWLEVKEDVIMKISELAKKNGCEFAYPTNTLWVKK